MTASRSVVIAFLPTNEVYVSEGLQTTLRLIPLLAPVVGYAPDDKDASSITKRSRGQVSVIGRNGEYSHPLVKNKDEANLLMDDWHVLDVKLHYALWTSTIGTPELTPQFG